jgi:hypothetical protein
MSDPTPTFAIVGAVNHGKSSVVSTLAEDDTVRVSKIPGETANCQEFRLRDLFAFYDTPGFQNPRDMLPEVAIAISSPEPLSVFRAFAERHGRNSDFEAELLLIQPILQGAGIIYVVDGSEPLREIHNAEMEILRLTGQPRLAIINRTGNADHVSEWKRRLGLHFNAVREFNAHHANFSDRLELLETLAGIDQSCKPKLMGAVAALREEWEQRLFDCAGVVTDLLFKALQHREIDSSGKNASPGSAKALRRRFIQRLARLETECHDGLIHLFGHHLVEAISADAGFLDSELFSDETWRMFGLTQKQTLVASAGLGATTGVALGAKVEIATLGSTLGTVSAAGATIGAGIGAVAALLVGKKRPEIEVKMPLLTGRLPWISKWKLSGSEMRVGPCAAVNFPWILIDRALGVFTYVVNRAHARRDDAKIESAQMKIALDRIGLSSSTWPAKDRDDCERLFSAIRRGNAGNKERSELNAVLLAHLRSMGETRIDLWSK